MEYNEQQLANGALTWAHIDALARFWQSRHGLGVDGAIGPCTIASLDAAIEDRKPRNQKDAKAMYGNPGNGAPDSRWERANIVECHNRGTRPRLPGVPTKWWFKVHRLVEPHLRRALKAANEASDYKIRRAGGYVFRHQRNNASRPLSYHAYGIAIDIDPSTNQAVHLDSPIEPWGCEWMKIWPAGLPRDFVEAMEDEGWAWGGRWKGYCDPMHFEWVER